MVFEKQRRSQGSSSFLKKRTKKLLLDLVRACRDRRVSQRTKVFPAYQPSNTGLYNALFSCMILSVVEVSDAGVDEGHDGCGV
jgi:hypothetical protein